MLTEMCLKSFGTFEKRALSFDSLQMQHSSLKRNFPLELFTLRSLRPNKMETSNLSYAGGTLRNFMSPHKR